MVRKLEELGLVEVVMHRVSLTAAGLDVAERSVRRHRLAERLLVDVLGLGWAEAHGVAGAWQHVIDDRVEEAIDRLLGTPATCPHGNPIPGRSVSSDGVALSSLAVGDVAQVRRVTEQLEVIPGMLESLERSGLVPGTRVEVLSLAPDGTSAVKACRGVVALSRMTADAILVTPGDLSAIASALGRASDASVDRALRTKVS
jgi:DtxR family Mn-dependent transcriptional regulator